MNVPIYSDGSKCVGDTVTLVACCPADVDVIWELVQLAGGNDVTLVPNGHTAELTFNGQTRYKVKASCCKS